MAMLKNDWAAEALCRNGDPDAMFVQGAEQNVAKRLCRGCPVRYECLADALDNRIEFGVWGGMTERERRALLRRHPRVVNWGGMFDEAIQAGELTRPGRAAPYSRGAAALGATAVVPVGESTRTTAPHPRAPLPVEEANAATLPFVATLLEASPIQSGIQEPAFGWGQ